MRKIKNTRRDYLKKQRRSHVIGTWESQYYAGPFYEVYSDGRIKEKIRFEDGAIQNNGFI